MCNVILKYVQKELKKEQDKDKIAYPLTTYKSYMRSMNNGWILNQNPTPQHTPTPNRPKVQTAKVQFRTLYPKFNTNKIENRSKISNHKHWQTSP